MAREKKNDMRLRVLIERSEWMVKNHQVKLQQRTFSFIQDMITRLQRGKGVSPNMRKWVDAIIEDGLEKVEVDGEKGKLLERITAALGVAHVSYNHNILGEFGSKLGRGWSLSEKQLAWCETMLAEAEADPWTPAKNEIETMNHLINIRYSRNAYWYQANGRTAQAMDAIHEYLTNGTSFRKYLFFHAAKSFSNRLNEIKIPRFKIGAKCFLRENKEWRVGFILTDPYTCKESRAICYDVLIDGVTERKGTESLSKRRT